MSDPLFKFRKADPVGEESATAFVDWSGPGGRREGHVLQVDVPTYVVPSEAAEFRKRRREYQLATRAVARVVGVSVQELCDLENGRQVPEDWRFWQHASAVLEYLVQEKIDLTPLS